MRVGYVAAAIAGIAAVLWLAMRPHGSAPVGSAAPAPSASLRESAAVGRERETPGAAAVQPKRAQWPTTPTARPQAAIRLAYEREARDAGAAAVEARIRSIYGAEPDALGVLRDVRCTQSVCKIEARWSAQLNHGYNAALLRVIAELSKEIALEPGGPPDGAATPIAIYVRRPATPSR
jgi:hypothetical protein